MFRIRGFDRNLIIDSKLYIATLNEYHKMESILNPKKKKKQFQIIYI